MKFLLLAFEGGEAGCMASLALRLRQGGHQVFIASLDHFSVTHTKDEVVGFMRRAGLSDVYANLDDCFRAINACPKDMKSEDVDWEFLSQFEHQYCRNFTLMRLANMDPLYLQVYHHRKIYHSPKNKNLFFKAIELNFKWLLRVFNENGPFDAVLTVNFQYMLKAAAFEVAGSMNIPFLMLSSCRIKDHYLLYDNFSLGTPQYILDEMARLQRSGAECTEAESYIEATRRTQETAYTERSRNDALFRSRLSIAGRLGELLRYCKTSVKRSLLVDRHYRGYFRRNYFLPSHLPVLRAMAASIWRIFSYFYYADLNRKDIPSGPFVFAPLHLIPENSVLTLSETLDEMECIYRLSNALPVDWSILVKINPSMLMDFDTHPNSYYREMNRLPNVRFISPLVASGEIIGKAVAVACISGTALLEAAIHGKPGIRWGRTEFEAIDIVTAFEETDCRSLCQRESENLKYYIQGCMNQKMQLQASLLLSAIGQKLSSQERGRYDDQIRMIESAILKYMEKRAMPLARGVA